MPEATDIQMQHYADERVRVHAEAIRAVKLACAADKTQIDDIYARAVGTNAWADARTDGPPHLLQSANGANPDDMLNYNSFCDLLAKFFAGSFADVNEANSAAAKWVVLERACVRPVSG